MRFTLSVRSFQVPGHALDLGLAAQLAFGAHLARHARHLGGEGAELSTIVLTVRAVRRNSPCSGRPSTSRAIVWERSPLATAPMTRAVSLVGCTRSLDEAVDALDARGPGAAGAAQRHALVDLAFLPHGPAEAVQLQVGPLDHGHDVVERVGDLARRTRPGLREADGEVPFLDRDQGGQHLALVEAVQRLALSSAVALERAALGPLLFLAFLGDGDGYFVSGHGGIGPADAESAKTARRWCPPRGGWR